MKNNAVHRLRLISFPEGLSFVLLLICVVLKSTTGFDGVKALGYIHGVIWTIYMLLGLWAWYRQRWSFWRAAWILALAALPLGGFYAERLLAREEVQGYGPAVAPAAA